MRHYAPYAFQLCIAAWLGVMAGQHRVETECRREAATLLSMSLQELTEMRL